MPDDIQVQPMNANVKAFLDMLAWSEGTSSIPDSDDGYRVLVGGGKFSTYADHPLQLIHIASLALSSTAAGRYQLLARYFDAYKKQLGLADFSPAAQDAIAIQQITERKAIVDIEVGRLDVAILKCSNIWASLPGGPYNQHVRPYPALELAFVNAGGQLQEGAHA